MFAGSTVAALQAYGTSSANDLAIISAHQMSSDQLNKATLATSPSVDQQLQYARLIQSTKNPPRKNTLSAKTLVYSPSTRRYNKQVA